MWTISISLNVKFFVWLLIWERISLKARLHRMNLIQDHNNVCSFYGNYGDDLPHLFIHWYHVGSLWYWVVEIWHVHFACPHGMLGLFKYWCHLDLSRQWIRVWRIAFLHYSGLLGMLTIEWYLDRRLLIKGDAFRCSIFILHGD